MSQTPEGAIKAAAARIGISVNDYLANLAASRKWCTACRSWIDRKDFHGDKARRDGLSTRCRNCSRRVGKRQWKAHWNDPEKVARRRTRQRLRGKRANYHTIRQQVRRDRLEEYEGRCAYCEGPVESFDHIVPVQAGGTNEGWNIVPCCRSCNCSKRDREMTTWIDSKGYPGTWQLWEQVSSWLY
jgi:hypothetical protein